jgi:hypothetical protein
MATCCKQEPALLRAAVPAVGGIIIRLLTRDVRDERACRFARLDALGARVGIRVRPCRCKNRELADRDCGIAGPPAPSDSATLSQGIFEFASGTAADTESQDGVGGRPGTPVP